LSTLVPATVSSISSLAKSLVPSLQIWSMHGLLLTIEAAGLSFVSHVQVFHFICQQHLVISIFLTYRTDSLLFPYFNENISNYQQYARNWHRYKKLLNSNYLLLNNLWRKVPNQRWNILGFERQFRERPSSYQEFESLGPFPFQIVTQIF
jgi:hypothetical protein